MPFSSAEISGMVGGQMAMFSNQAQFSQQIGGMMGMSPMGASAGGGMTNPFPRSENMGAGIAGGLGMALPGIATGVSLAGGLMGGRLGVLDPFTMAGRGFAAGAGASGAGFGATLGHVGRTFATGGVRAGLGVMGGGLAAGALAAAPLAAVGAGIQFMGENVYTGAQNYSQVGAMANRYMGPQWGEAGSRGGGQFGRQTIRQMTGALHELVGEDGIATMKELKSLMDQAGRMGMLTGITDAQGFKTKMRGMVQQVKAISDILGTTMEEAAPVLGQMRQMGLWKTSDIIGASVSMRAAGPAGSAAMLQTMQAGSQMSNAMGGTRRAGAVAGRQIFETMQAAVRSGVMSEEELQDFTGGVGGAEGQNIAGQRLMGLMTRFGQTSAGRAMMASVGEMKGGAFTGGIDRARLNKFLQGQGTGEMLREGYGRTRGREAAMSYTRYAETMSQNLMAEGGIEAMIQVVQKVADEKFGGNENARHLLFRQMLGANSQEAERLGKIADGLKTIQDKQLRDLEASSRRIFEEVDRKNLRSVDSLKRSAELMFEQAKRPFQEFGEKLSASYSEMVDDISSRLTGYTKAIPMGAAEKARLLRSGALTTDVSGLSIGGPSAQEWARGSPLANINLGMRQQGGFTKTTGGFFGGMAAGAAAGSFMGPLGMAVGAMAGGVAGAAGIHLVGTTPREQYLKNVGISPMASGQDLESGIAMAIKRAERPDAKALGVDERRIGPIRVKLSSLIGRKSAELRKLKEENPEGYTKALLSMMEGESRTLFAGMTDQQKLNALAVAQADEGLSASSLAADFKSDIARIGWIDSAEGARVKQDEIVEELASTAGVSPEQIKKAMTSGPGADVMAQFVSGELDKTSAIKALAKIKGSDETMKILEKLSGGDISKFQEQGKRFISYRKAQVALEGWDAMQKVAADISSDIRGLSAETKGQFSSLLEAYKGGEDKKLGSTEVTAIQEQTALLARSNLSEGDIKALRKRGGVIGRQIVALKEAGEIPSERMNKEAVSKLFEKFSNLGFDIEKMGGPEMERAMKEGVKASDAESFKKSLTDILQNIVPESKEARKSMTDEYTARIEYIKANERFVGAVAQALHGELVETTAEAVKQDGAKVAPQAAES